MSDSSDADALIDILHRAQAGEAPAINQLLSVFRPDIRKWIENKCGSRAASYVDISGVTQNALLCVHRELAAFRGQDINEFRSWIKRISLNRLVDEIRSCHAVKRGFARTQSLERPNEEGKTLTQQVAGPISTPSVQATRNELLLSAISKLPPEQQVVASGRFIEHLGIDEIASRLGVPAEEASLVLDRTMRNLNRHLKKTD